MIILGIDSTAVAASVALLRDGNLLGEMTLNNGNTHSETLLPTVEFLLKRLDLTVKDIDAYAFSAGPGSFTGVRIGAATVKGLAFGSNKPCMQVSTPEALALNLSATEGLICPVMNARRNQFYTALFRCKNGNLDRLLPDSALSAEELDEILSHYDEPVAFVGDGYCLAVKLLSHPHFETPERLRHQSGASVASVGLRLFREGLTVTARDLKPIYLRLPQAERERNERQNLTKKEGSL